MFDRMNGMGAHELIVETPSHDVDLGEMDVDCIARVLKVWRDRVADLKRDQRLRYVMVFREHGPGKSARLGHAVSQVVALPVTPMGIKNELLQSKQYFEFKQRCLFCDIIRDEIRMGERVVFENDAFLVLEPFASRFPFETWILPKAHQSDIVDLAPEERFMQLAQALKTALGALKEGLLNPSYGVVLHTVPNTVPRPDYWHTIHQDYHWHLEICPRVRRSTGMEMGSGFFLNPVLPEEASAFLREILKRQSAN